jgi:lipase chaperone protein
VRDVLGREVADTLWGDETKIHEYKMKELEILRTDIYSAQVKEQLINDLREQTFGDEDGQQDTDYNYQLYLKLAIYSDELMELSPEERDEKIKEFRNEIFPPDKLQFLEFLEGVVETDSEETNDSEQEAL